VQPPSNPHDASRRTALSFAPIAAFEGTGIGAGGAVHVEPDAWRRSGASPPDVVV
jgi:hypothetical protein